MMRRFALTFLITAFVASAAGCGPKKSVRAKKPKASESLATAPEAAPPHPTPPVEAAASVPPPTAVAPAAVPVQAAGAGGAPGSGMAVVILMLPASDATRAIGTAGGSGAPHTYKLSLSANASTAVIQVDGQPAVSAPVQRVFPTPARAPAVAAVHAPTAIVPRPAAAPRPRYLVPAAPAQIANDGTMEPGESHARQAQRASMTTAMRPPLPLPVMNPNGAPIID